MNEQKLTKWKKQLTQIQDDVRELLRGRKIFLDTFELIKRNKEAQKDIFSWWDYYKLNYTYFVLSKIYHQIDENPKADNLHNLLKDLYENCSMVSAEWWIGDGKSLSIDTFKEKFGGSTLTPANIYADLGDLLYSTKEVKEFRDKRIAHRDKSQAVSKEIDIKNIDESIDLIEKFVDKYTLLLEQRSLDLNIKDGDDWQKSFTIPWIEKK